MLTCSVCKVATSASFRQVGAFWTVQSDRTDDRVWNVASTWTVVTLLAQVFWLSKTTRLTVPASRAFSALGPVGEVSVVRPGRIRTAEGNVSSDRAIKSHWALGRI